MNPASDQYETHKILKQLRNDKDIHEYHYAILMQAFRKDLVKLGVIEK